MYNMLGWTGRPQLEGGPGAVWCLFDAGWGGRGMHWVPQGGLHARARAWTGKSIHLVSIQ